MHLTLLCHTVHSSVQRCVVPALPSAISRRHLPANDRSHWGHVHSGGGHLRRFQPVVGLATGQVGISVDRPLHWNHLRHHWLLLVGPLAFLALHPRERLRGRICSEHYGVSWYFTGGAEGVA